MGSFCAVICMVDGLFFFDIGRKETKDEGDPLARSSRGPRRRQEDRVESKERVNGQPAASLEEGKNG